MMILKRAERGETQMWSEQDSGKLGDIPSYGPLADNLGEAYGEGEYLCIDLETYGHTKIVKVRAETHYVDAE